LAVSVDGEADSANAEDSDGDCAEINGDAQSPLRGSRPENQNNDGLHRECNQVERGQHASTAIGRCVCVDVVGAWQLD
jgi:hypothetical protein